MKTVEPISDKQQWQQMARTFRDYTYRQIWDFSNACAERLNAANEHIAIRKNDQLLGLADVRIKKLPLFNTGIAYINGGPLIQKQDAADNKPLQFCLQSLIEEYVHNRALLLRIQPVPKLHVRQEVYEQLGFRLNTSTGRYQTILMDLNLSLEEIRKKMKQKWRNGLNRAEKNNLTVRAGYDQSLFDEFCGLFDQHIQRKGFDVDLPADFYAKLQPQLDKPEQFYIALAEYEGSVVAGHVSSILTDTCVYLLGASLDSGLMCKASYLLQWHVIQNAKDSNCHFYDLGGIDPEGNPGVCHFKRGLGGREITIPGPYEYKPGPLRAGLIKTAEKAYRILKKHS